MRRLRWIGAALTTLALAAAVGAAARPAERPSVAIFYYPWYGSPKRDGVWQHWDQNGARPPGKIASQFYPARGAYSSTDPRVVRNQLREIAATGIDTVIVSWWGPDSIEAWRLPTVTAAAHAAGLEVAVHVEPWPDRTARAVRTAVDSLHARGIDDFYVYDSSQLADEDWSAELSALPDGVRVFANTWLVGKAAAGGFSGLYPYDVVVYPVSSFQRVCRAAQKRLLACAPSIGPGFDSRRATGMTTVVPRRDGKRYDATWQAAAHAGADVITITSYNEWLEGTQIEPARARPGYSSYEGAYGLTGAAAESAYLTRTREWISTLG
ncbi:MAG: hypothetical protein U0R50_05070 [Gaiellales bacterium]